MVRKAWKAILPKTTNNIKLLIEIIFIYAFNYKQSVSRNEIDFRRKIEFGGFQLTKKVGCFEFQIVFSYERNARFGVHLYRYAYLLT